MTKAILVIDMPKSCLYCKLIWDEVNNGIVRCSNGRRIDNDNTFNFYKEKPCWCPLKQLPQKKTKIITKNDEYPSTTLLAEMIGWNECIDEILGKEESEGKE